MNREDACELVADVLAEIHSHKWLNLHVPHGFETRSMTAELQRNPFAPDVLSSWRVSPTLDVPVIYKPEKHVWLARASAEPTYNNVDTLRAWIEYRLSEHPLHLRLTSWDRTRDNAPAPYNADGTPNGPPADWQIRFAVEVHN